MKNIEYLSPSSLTQWADNQDEFYMRYLADERPPKMAQNRPMSIGSAFDAYVKAYLHEKLFGKDNDPKYSLDALFDSQVEEQNRDWARPNGKYLFEQYKQAGCLADLMLELNKASSDPRFEFEVKGAVNGYREGLDTVIGDVVLLGKPDVHFVNANGTTVIIDFKVNGYCSRASPMSGYIRLRSAGNTRHMMHKDCTPMQHNGMLINIARYLEQQDPKWAQQLAIYAWLTGNPVGSEFLVGIDQVACVSNNYGFPEVRFAEHRTRVSPNFQLKVYSEAAYIWDVVHSDHIFRDLTKAKSQERASMLDKRSRDLRGEGTPLDQWFANATRG